MRHALRALTKNLPPLVFSPTFVSRDEGIENTSAEDENEPDVDDSRTQAEAGRTEHGFERGETNAKEREMEEGGGDDLGVALRLNAER